MSDSAAAAPATPSAPWVATLQLSRTQVDVVETVLMGGPSIAPVRRTDVVNGPAGQETQLSGAEIESLIAELQDQLNQAAPGDWDPEPFLHAAIDYLQLSMPSG